MVTRDSKGYKLPLRQRTSTTNLEEALAIIAHATTTSGHHFGRSASMPIIRSWAGTIPGHANTVTIAQRHRSRRFLDFWPLRSCWERSGSRCHLRTSLPGIPILNTNYPEKHRPGTPRQNDSSLLSHHNHTRRTYSAPNTYYQTTKHISTADYKLKLSTATPSSIHIPLQLPGQRHSSHNLSSRPFPPTQP